MKLNDISTKITQLTNADTNDYTNALRLIDINNAQDAIEAIILRSQDGWKFDDSNQTDQPILTINLSANVQSYDCDPDIIKIEKLQYSSDGTTYRTALSLDPRDLPDIDPTTQFSMSNPAYTVIGKKLYLYPTPTSNVTNGVKITAGRLATEFTMANLTTTTASDMVSPGFDRSFHMMVPLYCAIQWALAKGLSNLNALKGEWNENVIKLRDFFSNKVSDRNARLEGKKTNWK